MQQPLAVRLLSLVLVLGTGTFVAVFIARIAARQMRELDRRSERFAALLRIAADRYWELDERLRFSKFSEERPAPPGLDAASRIGRHPWELPLGLSDDALDAHRADLEAHRPFRDLIGRARGADGTVRFVSISGEPRFDERGLFRGYWGVGRDITDEVRVRQAREASETRYHELFERSLSALVLHRAGLVIDANAAALQLFGYPDLAAMVGRDLLDHYPDRRCARAPAARIEQMETMPVGWRLPAADFALQTCDGRRRDVRVTGVRVEADGAPATLSIFVDETERRAAESALRGSQALLSQLVATSPDLITLTDMETGRFVMVNDSFTRLLGYTRRRSHRPHVGRARHLARRRRPRAAASTRMRQRGRVQDLPLDVRRQVAARRCRCWCRRRGFEMERPRLPRASTRRDVSATERTRLEREAMLDNASIGIAFTRDRSFVQANPRFEQMFGWADGALAGQPGRVVWAERRRRTPRSAATLGPQLAQGEQVEFERADARAATAAASGAACSAKAVDPTRPGAGGTIWIVEDITERRRVEQALAQARDDGRSGQPRQERVPGQHQPRAAHAAQRPARAGPAGADAATSTTQRRRQYLDQIGDSAQSARRRSSPTSSTCRRSRPAS